MTAKQQLIADVERLPERSIHLVSILVNEIISMDDIHGEEKTVRPPFKFGSMKGKVWMADDFDEPLEFIDSKRLAMFDCLYGQYKIAEDFDEPLEDFKEYTE